MGNVYSTFCEICPINPPPELLRSQARAEDSDGALAQFTWSARGTAASCSSQPHPHPSHCGQWAALAPLRFLRAKSLPAPVPWILRSPVGVFFLFFCIFILIIISVCWWRVGHTTTTAPVWRPEDTFRKSVLSFHPGLWRWNSGHQTCEQAPNYLASFHGSLWSPWVDIFLAPKASLSVSIMYNFSHGFHSEWLP